MNKPKKKGGQPSTYTQEVGEAICERLALGQSLLSICKEMGVSYEAARNWERDIPAHGTNSTRARELGCHVLAEECVQIADDDTRDWEPVTDSEGRIIGIKVDGEHVQRAKLRIDTRMRLIGKWLPKVYGDRTTLAGDPDAPLTTVNVDLSKTTPEQLRALASLKLGDATS